MSIDDIFAGSVYPERRVFVRDQGMREKLPQASKQYSEDNFLSRTQRRSGGKTASGRTPGRSRRKMVLSEGGFSLIELLIVMVILGLLASLVGPKMFSKLGMAKQKTAKTQIEMLMTALDSYRLDVGTYPSASDGLEALIKNPGVDNWNGPYLQKGMVPLDPWHRAYHYDNPGRHGDVDIYSYGLDGQPGGTGENADVDSWD